MTNPFVVQQIPEPPQGAPLEKDVWQVFAEFARNAKMPEDHFGLVINAAVLGWTVYLDSNGASARLEKNGRSIVVGSTHMSRGKLRNIQRKLNAYADPDRVSIVKHLHTDEFAKADPEILIGLSRSVPMDVRVYDPHEYELDSVHCGHPYGHKEHRWELYCVWPKDESPEAVMLGIVWCSGKKDDCPTLTPQEAHMPDEPTVFSEQPWMAHQTTHKGTAKAYPTRSTIERTWTDGHKDYRCAFEDCDVVRDKPHQVVRHFASAHVRHGALKPQGKPSQLVDDPNFEGTGLTRRVRPRQYRIDALARHLRDLDMTDMSADQIAEEVLAWIAEQSSSGSDQSMEREPLTPEQIITRIRTLVDSGVYVEQHDALEESRLQIAQLEEQLEQERQERTRLTESLTAFQDLLRDVLPTELKEQR